MNFLVGELNTARAGHSVIRMQYDFLVVGGGGDDLTERCEFYNSQGSIICAEQEPRLMNYAYYPEMHAVTDNYCK